MAIETASSWRELDDAITEISRPKSERHAHSTVVFRGLARTDYSHVSSLARLRGDYQALERHLRGAAIDARIGRDWRWRGAMGSPRRCSR